MEEQKEKPKEEKKSMIEQVKEQVTEFKKVKDELKEQLDRQEKLKADEIMAGKADAGQEKPKEKTEEEKITDEVNEFLKGTGHQV